jgi:hypothetical protein
MKNEEEIEYINSSYKTKISINPLLQDIFNQSAGNRRFIYNQLLNILNKSNESKINKIIYTNEIKDEDGNINFVNNSISIKSKVGIQKILVDLQNDFDFLKKSHSQSNQEASHSLIKAYKNYLNPKMKNAGQPNFRGRKNI